MRFSAGVAAATLVAFSFAVGAAADSLPNASGSITLATIGTVTANAPFSSGQMVTVTLHANSALGLNNGVAGPYNIEECQAPNGVLPTVPTGNCDGSTIVQVSAVNADGSLAATAFKIYALPNAPTFDETAGAGQPNCGLAPNDCVLYVGSPIGANTSFPSAHLFSPAFVIASNSDDKGENPGDGTVGSRPRSDQAPVTTHHAPTKPRTAPTSVPDNSATKASRAASSPAKTAAAGSARTRTSTTSSARATSSSSLAFTGPSPTLAWLGLAGAFLVLAASFALRRTRPGVGSPGP
jgi:hypothetical protein